MAIGFLLQVMGGSITIDAVGRRFAEAFATGQQMSLEEAFTIILVPSPCRLASDNVLYALDCASANATACSAVIV